MHRQQYKCPLTETFQPKIKKVPLSLENENLSLLANITHKRDNIYPDETTMTHLKSYLKKIMIIKL